jgi:hypothetical protein
MPFKLSGLNLNRVDLCPAGANQGAEIVLFKSKEANVPAPKKKTAAKAPAKKADTRSKAKQKAEEEDEEEEDVDKSLEDDDDESEEEDVEKADDEDDDADDDAENEDEEDEEEKPARKSKKTVPAKKTAKKVVKAKVDDDDEGDVDDEADEDEAIEELDPKVLKSLPASVQKAIADSQRIAKQAIKIANIEKDKRVTTEFIAKAKKEIPHLTGTDEEKGGILKALYSGQPIAKDVAKSIVKLLKSGDAAIRTLLLSDTRKGRVRNDDDSAYSQLCEKRDELIAADPKLSKEQAMEKAMTDNRELYNEYRIEKRRARRQADAN